MKSDGRTTVALGAELLLSIRTLAEMEDRSVSYLVRKALLRELESARPAMTSAAPTPTRTGPSWNLHDFPAATTIPDLRPNL